ncbi:Uncharacterised protein [uncultured archaeon]|nr:Uncharacterised protein [uncultured archaeon]
MMEGNAARDTGGQALAGLALACSQNALREGLRLWTRGYQAAELRCGSLRIFAAVLEYKNLATLRKCVLDQGQGLILLRLQRSLAI